MPRATGRARWPISPGHRDRSKAVLSLLLAQSKPRGAGRPRRRHRRLDRSPRDQSEGRGILRLACPHPRRQRRARARAWPISPQPSRSARTSFAHFWRGVSLAATRDHAGAIDDFTRPSSSIPRTPHLFLACAQLRGQRRDRPGHRRLHQGDRDTSPTTPSPTASGPRPTPTRATATTPLPTSPGPSSSSQGCLRPRHPRRDLRGQERARPRHCRPHEGPGARSEKQVGIQQQGGQLCRHRCARSRHLRLPGCPGAAVRDRRRSPMAGPGAWAHRTPERDQPVRANGEVTQAKAGVGRAVAPVLRLDARSGPLRRPRERPACRFRPTAGFHLRRPAWRLSQSDSIRDDPALMLKGQQFADIARHQGRTHGVRGRARPWRNSCAGSWARSRESTNMAYKGNDLDLQAPRTAGPGELPQSPRSGPQMGAWRPAVAGRGQRPDSGRRHRAGLLQLRLRRRALPCLAGCAARASAACADARQRRSGRAGRARHPRRYPPARDGGGHRRGDARRPRRGPCGAARLRRIRGRAAARRRPGRQAARPGRPARPAQDHPGRRSRLARGCPPDGAADRSASARALARRAACARPSIPAAPRRRAPNQLPPASPEALLARLDHMEAALRALQTQVAADRQALGDLLRDVQSGLQVLRSEGTHAVASDRARPSRACSRPSSAISTSPWARSASASPASTRSQQRAKPGSSCEPTSRPSRAASARRPWTSPTASPTRSRSASARPSRACSACRRRRSGIGAPTASAQIALEASVRAHLQGAEEAGKKHERDLGEVYQALVKLGANQQTLGDNFTAWRIETGGDIGIVSNRLQQLEQNMLDLLGHLGSRVAGTPSRAARRPQQPPRLQALALRHRQRLGGHPPRRRCRPRQGARRCAERGGGRSGGEEVLKRDTGCWPRTCEDSRGEIVSR